MAFESFRSDSADIGGSDSSRELSQVNPISFDCLGIQAFVLPAVGEVRGDE